MAQNSGLDFQKIVDADLDLQFLQLLLFGVLAHRDYFFEGLDDFFYFRLFAGFVGDFALFRLFDDHGFDFVFEQVVLDFLLNVDEVHSEPLNELVVFFLVFLFVFANDVDVHLSVLFVVFGELLLLFLHFVGFHFL